MPDKLTPEGWAKGVLSGASLYGPVEGRRWKGSHKDIDKDFACPRDERSGLTTRGLAVQSPSAQERWPTESPEKGAVTISAGPKG
jgi:hypothetical protein